MGGLSNSLLLLGALVPSVYLGWYPFLNTFAGRIGDAKLHTDHINHGPLNNDKCQVFPGMLPNGMGRKSSAADRSSIEGQACEDVRIHYDTGMAFLGNSDAGWCGDRY